MFKKIIIFILALFLAAPVTIADDSSIIPVLWLFATNGNLDWQDWKDIFNDVSRIYQYNSEHEKIGDFEPYGPAIYQFNAQHEKIGYFEPFGPAIYQFNAQYEKIGYFEPFGPF